MYCQCMWNIIWHYAKFEQYIKLIVEWVEAILERNSALASIEQNDIYEIFKHAFCWFTHVDHGPFCSLGSPAII